MAPQLLPQISCYSRRRIPHFLVNTAMIAELESPSRPLETERASRVTRRAGVLRPSGTAQPDPRRARAEDSCLLRTQNANLAEPDEARREPTPSPPPAGSAPAARPGRTGEDYLLELYQRDALREPLLEAAEEAELGRRAHAGDESARQRLVVSNLRLVIRIAAGYRAYGLPLADLISEGNLGLLRAARLFNPSFGARFSTYASAWIKQRIRRALSNQSRLVRLPLGVVECLSRVRQAEARLLGELGRDPTDAELAADTELVDYLIHRLRTVAHQSYVSLDSPTVSEADGPTLSETLADPGAESPAESLARAGDCAFTRELLATLSPREQEVLELRYGFDGGEGRSMEEVGNLLGVVRQRVQQIEAAALIKLRKRARQRQAA